MTTESLQNADLAELVDALSTRIQRGEVVDAASLEREYPQHGDRLRDLLPALQAIAGTARNAELRALEHIDSADRVVGDFRLIREIGRGGMGIVYEAQQRSLARRVAVKILPFAAMLDQRQIARFRNESQTAAILHHPNIVPVYAVGADRGIHHYAMQLIDGQSLDGAIQQLRASSRIDVPENIVSSATRHSGATEFDNQEANSHSELMAEDTRPLAALTTEQDHRSRSYIRAVARITIETAGALAHAHELGVVHRDIKPGNLLLDFMGKVWITDFGLAHMQSDQKLTMTGDLVGTLRYMSPEQALAKHASVDHRTDVYSLGVTLYELLTLQPAYDGKDRQELLRQIAFEEPIRPRQKNNAIPAALETIVLKAIAKTPDDRYSSASDMANDLQRFLEDRPILAKRPTLYERSIKWSRRHPSVVIASFVVLMILAAALTFTTLAVCDARFKALAERDREAAGRIVAEQRSALAYGALERLVTSIETTRLDASIERAFLQETLSVHRQVAATAESDAQFSKTQGEIARIKRLLARTKNAQFAE